MKKISLSLFNAMAGLFLVLLLMAGTAQAQGLTMNITDTGYDPIGFDYVTAPRRHQCARMGLQ